MDEPLTCYHCGYTGEEVVVVRTYSGHTFSHCTDVLVCTERSEIGSKFRNRKGN